MDALEGGSLFFLSGCWLNIKIPSFRHKKSYCADKTVEKLGFPILVRWHSYTESAHCDKSQWRLNKGYGVSNQRRPDFCSSVCFGAFERNHQGSASLAFVSGIHRWPVGSSYKGPVTWYVYLKTFLCPGCALCCALLWFCTGQFYP